jgi:L-rhamnose mutarotase
MSVNPNEHAEYERRHRPIWDELADVLREHGVHNYSIFLDEATSDLFGYVEIESEERWEAIAQTEVCQRWWRHMSEIMPSHPDHRPKGIELREVFHLD